MVKALVMAAPQFEEEFHVTGDASGFCIEIILWQYGEEKEEMPIHYASRQMSPVEKNYTTTEKECLPIIYACKKLRHYLLGYDVVFHTDHDAIKHLVNEEDLSKRIARSVMLLQEFQYRRIENKNVDSLSRLEEDKVIQSIKSDNLNENLFSVQAVQPGFFPEIEISGPIMENPKGRNSPRKNKIPNHYLDQLKRSMKKSKITWRTQLFLQVMHRREGCS
jgi:hypothetical protein